MSIKKNPFMLFGAKRLLLFGANIFGL